MGERGFWGPPVRCGAGSPPLWGGDWTPFWRPWTLFPTGRACDLKSAPAPVGGGGQTSRQRRSPSPSARRRSSSSAASPSHAAACSSPSARSARTSSTAASPGAPPGPRLCNGSSPSPNRGPGSGDGKGPNSAPPPPRRRVRTIVRIVVDLLFNPPPLADAGGMIRHPAFRVSRWSLWYPADWDRPMVLWWMGGRPPHPSSTTHHRNCQNGMLWKCGAKCRLGRGPT